MSDDARSGAEAYAVAFKIGVVGNTLIIASWLVAPLLAVLLALSIWMLITLFVLPWCYICWMKRHPRVPAWLRFVR